MLVEQMRFFNVLPLGYFVLYSKYFPIYSKSNYSEMVSNIQIYCTVFFPMYLPEGGWHLHPVEKGSGVFGSKGKILDESTYFFFSTQLSFLYYLCACKF